MRILIVGASGYIGGAVSLALLRAGHTVEALVRKPAAAASSRRSWQTGATSAD